MTPRGLLAPSIAIVNVDTDVTAAEIEAACLALTRQCCEHFAPAWGEIATVYAGPVRDGSWRLELRKVPTLTGALGYHDRDADGTPILYVFPELCAGEGESWTSCASHEILEALADPLGRRCVQSPTGEIYALEVADAVESDTYQINGVLLSNFCFPAWGEPMPGAQEQYDFLGLCTKPFEIRAGGYAQTFTPGVGWKQLGARSAYRQRVADLGLARSQRRGKLGAA